VRDELARLLRHSAIYGLAGLASRIASVLLLPFLTRELGPSSYGRIETMVALIALLVPLLRAGVATAFFRFYYEREPGPERDLVVRTSFWFTVVGAGAGLVVGLLAAPALSSAMLGGDEYANLVRVAFVILAVQLLYEQLTALYRVEERSVAFTIASLANLVVTVVATIVFVFVLDDGATGALVGNAFGTAVVLVVLIWQRRAALRPAYDRGLVRQMNRFGLPLLPAGLAIWVVDFADRLLLGRIVDQHEVGLYAVGVKIASAMVLVQLAFRTAWPAFAYSLEEGGQARRTFAYVLTYTSLLGCWMSLALGLLAPWLVDLLAAPEFAPAERVVAPLAFSGALLMAYTTLSIAASRANRTDRYWQVAVAGAAVNILLNLLLVPKYGMEGAAAATVVAYVVLAGGMAWLAQRLYPVPYEWRRLTIAVTVGVVLYAAGRLLDVPLAGALALTAAYPVVLGAVGFYQPAERRRLVTLAARMRPR
jgi:O-antigen/teichoic acid export membrane protein